MPEAFTITPSGPKLVSFRGLGTLTPSPAPFSPFTGPRPAPPAPAYAPPPMNATDPTPDAGGATDWKKLAILAAVGAAVVWVVAGRKKKKR